MGECKFVEPGLKGKLFASEVTDAIEVKLVVPCHPLKRVIYHAHILNQVKGLSDHFRSSITRESLVQNGGNALDLNL